MSRDVPISSDGIRLGQFLKFAGMIDSGADAKGVIADGRVTVNDEVETRRGRQLHHGDTVAFDDQVARVTADDDAVTPD
ncbi:RNA-binding protein [Mycolicibacterium madagascariense]|uniref:RNA-binding protein n=1 Tax=Mycolicibacterium madagascariense TaxID=212765 RepID=A0A7I7XGN3_9MYCO|nr:RNA-binding S4 domain-containing protein [Mycolicibacterium madagascariense]MCV7013314.1 RNA-binding S4 domain-containing protein [Mycolicibacterium madagascariense]BBZ28367.1 RNA-binding protein [Mycolicibacterium madagascariense]